MKKRRPAALKVTLGCIIAFSVIILLLPTILSIGPVRQLVLNQVNGKLDGVLAVESWSLNWSSRIQARNITFDDRAATRVHIERVAIPKGILALLKSTINLGHVEVVRPQIDLLLAETGLIRGESDMPTKGVARPSKKLKEEQVSPGALPGRRRSAVAAKPFRSPVDIQGKIEILDGSINVKSADADQPLAIRNMNASMDIESLNEPSAFQVTADIGDDAGKIGIKGSMKLLSDGVLDVNGSAADVQVDISDFQIGPLAALAGNLCPVPNASGTLNVRLSARTQGVDKLSAKGNVLVEGFDLSGGVLGKDSPSFEKLTLELDVEKNGDHVSIRTLTFDSSVIRFKTSGELQPVQESPYPKGALSCDVELDMAELAAQLPHTLKLKKGLSIIKGVLDLDVKMSSDQKRTFTCDARIRDVDARMHDRSVQLDAPVMLQAKATQDKDGLRLDKLDLTSSFATSHSSGNLDRMEVVFSADMGKALAEAGKFSDLGDLSGRGTVSVRALVASAGDHRKQVSCDVDIKNLRLSGLTKEPIRQDSLKLRLAATVNFNDRNAIEDIVDTSMKLDSEMVQAELRAKRTVLPISDGGFPGIDGIKLTASGNLSGIASFVRSIGALPPELDMTGEVVLNCRGRLQDDAVSMQILEAKLSSFAFKSGDMKTAKQTLRLRGVIRADLGEFRAECPELTLNIDAGRLKMSDSVVPDWRNVLSGAKAHVHGDIALGKLMYALGEFASLPEGTALDGRLRIDLVMNAADNRQKVTLSASVDELKIESQGKPVFKEDGVELAVDGEIASRAGNVSIRSLSLRSTPVSLSASLGLRDWRDAKMLDVQGSQTCDFTRIAALIALFTDVKIDIAGKRPESFSVQTSLKGEKWQEILRQTVASAGIYLERAKFFGIKMGKVEVPLVVSNSMAAVTINTIVNEGKVALAPVIKVGGEIPILTLPDNSKILSETMLDDDIANKLLAFIHPVFRGCTVTAGRMNLNMEKLRVPLDKTLRQKTTFNGVISLRDMNLSASGLLKMILDLTRQKDTEVAVPDRDISFKCENGRIAASPLEISAGKYSIMLSGSVGLDQTLQYFVDIPITREMVGRDVYKYLKDETIRIPISGTISEPDWGDEENVVQSVLKNLIKKASRKLIKDEGKKFLETEGQKFLESLF